MPSASSGGRPIAPYSCSTASHLSSSLHDSNTFTYDLGSQVYEPELRIAKLLPEHLRRPVLPVLA